MDRITEQLEQQIRIEHRDRWVWLCIGIFILCMCVAIAIAGIAHAGFANAAGPDPSGSDGTVDMIRNSGPATGAVLVLFYFLRMWQGDIKTDLALIRAKQEAGTATDTQAAIQIHGLRADFDAHRTETNRRLKKLEDVDSED